MAIHSCGKQEAFQEITWIRSANYDSQKVILKHLLNRHFSFVVMNLKEDASSWLLVQALNNPKNNFFRVGPIEQISVGHSRPD